MQKNIFVHIHSFFNTIIFIAFISLLFSGCNEKKDDKPQIQVEDTTEIFTPKDLQQQTEKSEQKISTKQQKVHSPDHFTLIDKAKNYEVTFKNKQLTLGNINLPIILINFFQTDCNACKTQIKSLTKLGKKYKNKLQILNLWNNDQEADNVRFLHHIMTTLRLSSELTEPVSVLYANGQYYAHFEGLIPIEMLQYEIDQAIQK